MIGKLVRYHESNDIGIIISEQEDDNCFYYKVLWHDGLLVWYVSSDFMKKGNIFHV